MIKTVLVKREEREFTSMRDVISGQKTVRYWAYYVEIGGAKVYLDLPADLKKLVNLGGDLHLQWDKAVKYQTNQRTLNWNVAPAKNNNELFQFLFARQIEMDFEGNED